MRSVVAILMLAALALSGCTNPRGNANGNSNANTASSISVPLEPPKPGPAVDPGFASCNPYFPLKPGATIKYTLYYPTGLHGDATVVFDQVEENGRKIFVEKTHIIDKETRGLEILKLTERRFACDGERIHIVSEKTETKVKDESSRVTFNYRDTMFLPSPSDLARKGFTWKQVFTQSFVRGDEPPANLPDATVVIYEVLGEEEITLPVGKFKAVKVKKTVGTIEGTDYYVKGLGLARSDTSTGGRWDLESFAHLTPVQ